MKRKSQADRLLDFLSDGKPHRTDEIQLVVYGSTHAGTARIASRANDLRNRGFEIPKAMPDKEIDTLYWYTLGNPPKPKPKMMPVVVVKDGIEHVRMVPSGGH